MRKPIHNFKWRTVEQIERDSLGTLPSLPPDIHNKDEKEVQKMASIKDEALAYQPKQMRNIAELESVPTEINVLDGTGTDPNTGNTFNYKYIELSGEAYRVPGKVLGDLKAILAKKPSLKSFSVTKKGQGIGTQYTVIPLD